VNDAHDALILIARVLEKGIHSLTRLDDGGAVQVELGLNGVLARAGVRLTEAPGVITM